MAAFKERYARIFNPKDVLETAMKGETVFCCVFAAPADSTFEVGIYDIGELELWRVKDLLDSRDTIFVKYDPEGDRVPF